MYVQITTACNMTCEHCCFSATRKGTRMSRANFMYAMLLAEQYGEAITIGGGEPTTHPEFFDFLELAMKRHLQGLSEFPPFLVTNGKLKTKAHKLLNLVENDEPVCVELSQDWFHDPIDPTVVSRFKRHQARREDSWRNGYRFHTNENGGYAGIRDVSLRIMPWGRALEKQVFTEDPSHDNRCICDDAFVDPEGRVWSCGCKTHQLGWVWEDDVLIGYNRDYAHEGGFECHDDIDLELDDAELGDSEVNEVPESFLLHEDKSPRNDQPSP